MTDYFLPDDFARDPYGWATNQLGHFAIGLFAAFALGGEAMAVWIVMAFFIAWEARQLLQGGTFADGLTDTAFVLAGALWTLTGGSWAILLAVAVGLALGWWRRS